MWYVDVIYYIGDITVVIGLPYNLGGPRTVLKLGDQSMKKREILHRLMLKSM